MAGPGIVGDDLPGAAPVPDVELVENGISVSGLCPTVPSVPLGFTPAYLPVDFSALLGYILVRY